MYLNIFSEFRPGRLGQWIAAIVVGGLGSWSTGISLSWTLAAFPKIADGEAGFYLTDNEISWVATSLFLGNILSPIPSGYIMDLIGRKWVLLVLNMSSIASWICALSSHSAAGLYAMRFLGGIWSGVIYAVAPVYLGEVTEADIRGSATGFFAISIYLGSLYVTLVGAYVSYDLLNWLSFLVPILFTLFLLLLPESPYYHLMKGNKEAARNSLLWLREEAKVDSELERIEAAVKEQLENPGLVIDILRKPSNRKALFVVLVLGLIQRTSGLSLLFTFSSVFLPDTFVSVSVSVILLNVVWFISGALGVGTSDKFGRKTMSFVSCLGAGVLMFGVSVWYYLRDFTSVDVSSLTWVPLAILCAHGFVYSIGLISVPTQVQGEVFPVNVKAKASALTSAFLGIVSCTIVKIYEPLTSNFGIYSNFLLCSSSNFLALFFIAFFMFETKGKTLEEIQDFLCPKKVNDTPKE